VEMIVDERIQDESSRVALGDRSARGAGLATDETLMKHGWEREVLRCQKEIGIDVCRSPSDHARRGPPRRDHGRETVVQTGNLQPRT
jgi:hypothetical protein